MDRPRRTSAAEAFCGIASATSSADMTTAMAAEPRTRRRIHAMATIASNTNAPI